MSNTLNVTFIGGSADLTRKVIECGSRYFDVAVVPPHTCATFHDQRPPERMVCNIERYRISQISDTHAVAIHEPLLRC